MSSRRKPNKIAEQFIAHTREMRESIAWRYLPDNARRILDRLELEHMHHAGGENGRLPCTYADFARAGIRRRSVSLAIQQCEALGFLEVTNAGRAVTGGKPMAKHVPAHLPHRQPQQCAADARLADGSRRKDEALSVHSLLQPKFKKPGAKTAHPASRAENAPPAKAVPGAKTAHL
jgi:hypothetical protein